MGLIGDNRCKQVVKSTKVEIEWVLLGDCVSVIVSESTKVEIEWVLLGFSLWTGKDYLQK